MVTANVGSPLSASRASYKGAFDQIAVFVGCRWLSPEAPIFSEYFLAELPSDFPTCFDATCNEPTQGLFCESFYLHARHTINLRVLKYLLNGQLAVPFPCLEVQKMVLDRDLLFG